METVNDLEQLAARLGLRIPRADLERWGPRFLGFLRDVDHLAALPIANLEPAFTPGSSGVAGPEGSGTA